MIRTLIALTLLLVLAACGGDTPVDPNPPPPPRPHLIVAREAVTLSALGETHTVAGTVNGQDVPVSLSLISEQRWNSALPVVDVQGSKLTASGAGTARFQATAVGVTAHADTVTVSVTPEPYVLDLSAAAPVDNTVPLVVTGYRLNEVPVSGFNIPGVTVSVEVLDSTRIALTMPPIAASQCVGGVTPFAPSGVTVLAEESSFSRARLGERILAVGEPVDISGAELACLKLAGEPGAEFALAYFDTRYTYHKSSVALPLTKTEQMQTQVKDLTGPPSAGAWAPRFDFAPALLGPVDEDEVGWNTDSYQCLSPHQQWHCSHEPMQPGGGLVLVRNGVFENYQAAIVTDYFVLATPVSQVVDQGLLERAEKAMDRLTLKVADYYEPVWGPRPAHNSGQYVIALWQTGEGELDGVGGSAGPLRMHINAQRGATEETLFYVMAHEFAHSADMYYRQRWFPDFPHADLFSSEGLADFVGWRMVAESFGYPILENLRPGDQGRSHGFSGGRIEQGYDDAANLAFDFTWRLAEKTGWEWSAAHDTVAIGMAGNRWGCNALGCDAIDGLYDKMQRYMGNDWDPADAILTTALSAIADDYMDPPSAIHHYPYIRGSGGSFRTGPSRRMIISGSGATVDFTQLVGSFGNYFLRDVRSGAFAASSPGSSSVRWRVMRLR